MQNINTHPLIVSITVRKGLSIVYHLRRLLTVVAAGNPRHHLPRAPLPLARANERLAFPFLNFHSYCNLSLLLPRLCATSTSAPYHRFPRFTTKHTPHSLSKRYPILAINLLLSNRIDAVSRHLLALLSPRHLEHHLVSLQILRHGHGPRG